MILLPVPKHVSEGNGSLLVSMDAMIMMDASCPRGTEVYARMLKEEILKWTGLELGLNRGASQPGDIKLCVDEALGANAYTVSIEETGACLCGGSLDSLGWAVQTLRQIVRQCAGLLPCMYIEDEPEIVNRGFYHDVTRGRVQTLAHLKGLVDTMAFYKMNQLQLYVEHTYLFRGFSELWRDETPLCAEEILELDDYCAQRGIELVPSLSTFGHLYKLLSTRTYEELCELPDSAGRLFSFEDRMAHHTVNVSNPDAIHVIEGMVEEFMHLFRSDKFNICADETFDLGKGRSKKLADEKGVGNLYVDYVMELFDFLIERGKKPMFWGDVITHHPELYAKLPEGVVCLNWGYNPEQSDRETRILHDAGATQYVCPGACGWNTWINLFYNSYRNVKLMCGYARQYGAIGVLNTDWGDFGHVNHPIFSVPGLIYGAVFSWSDAELTYEELNRQISILEFGDSSGRLLNLLGKVSDEMRFSWRNAVLLKELAQKKVPREKIEEHFWEEDMGKVAASNSYLEDVQKELPGIIHAMDSSCRGVAPIILNALQMIITWNKVGLYLSELDASGKAGEGQDGMALAAELECNLRHYRDIWRENSREGDIGRITDVFCWYADLLRDTSK